MFVMAAECAFAQFQQSPYDDGAADSVRVRCSIVATGQSGQYAMQAKVYGFFDADTAGAVAFGFGWDSPKAKLDSASLAPSLVDCMSDFGTFFKWRDIDSTNHYRRFMLLAFRVAGRYTSIAAIPALGCFLLHSDGVGQRQTLIIDTATIESCTLDYADNGYHAVRPFWTGLVVTQEQLLRPPHR
jgi:hypothetical protein